LIGEGLSDTIEQSAEWWERLVCGPLTQYVHPAACAGVIIALVLFVVWMVWGRRRRP
jgi:uncharacterized protein (TIGR03382 family)